MKCIICDHEMTDEKRSVCDLCLMNEAMLSVHNQGSYTFPNGKLSISSSLANSPNTLNEMAEIRWLNNFNKGGRD